MGESTTVRTARGSASVAVVLIAAALLTGCSALGRGVGAAPAPSAAPAGNSVASGASSAPAPSTPIASADPVAPATPTPTPTVADGRAKVTPFVTSAVLDGGTLTVGALIPTVVEDGGECTLTATDGSATLTATAAGVSAGSSTGCAPLTLADVPAGTWRVRVHYESRSAVGTSAEKPVAAG